MKIRTQLIISTVFFVVALAIISASVVSTNQQVERLVKQEALAKNIELKAGELSYLSNDYLLYHESQQIDRWESKYSSLSDDVSNLTAGSPEQQVLVDNIKASRQRLKDIFGDIVSEIENEPENQPNTADPDFIQVSWSRMGVQTQGIVFDASRLSQMLRDVAEQKEQQNNLLIFALMGAFVAFLLTDYLLIYRRTLKSVLNLQDGTRIIGSGNLDHSIYQKKGDEIGELAHAFNLMTANLKTVTASKADLEREIVERKQAEEELCKSEVKYRTVADYTYNWEFWRNPEGRLLYCSPSCKRITGYSADEFLADSNLLRSVVYPDDLKIYDNHFYEGKREELSEHEVEFRIVRPDGSVRWIGHTCQSVFDAGLFLGTRGSNRDITERKRSEEALRESERRFSLILRKRPSRLHWPGGTTACLWMSTSSG